MKLNVLIVEDENDMLDILTAMVEMLFMEDFPFLKLNISKAENGLVALERAQKESQDIIITDINMPVMNGLEFIQKTRIFDKTVPILVLTALSSQEDINKIMQSGASNYTAKPLNSKLFFAQIKLFVNFYLRRQSKYNNRAINLFSKEIFKRKTEFLIEKEDDLAEFWEYLEEGSYEKYKVENVLQFIYALELLNIKKNITNSIILEESNEYYYFTINEIEKIDADILQSLFKKNSLDMQNYKEDGFFISLRIAKQEEDVKKIKSDISGRKEESRLHDIRYSIHEQVSPEEFIAELDPTIEDKIEDFLDDISLISMKLYDLETADLVSAKKYIQEIIGYFNNFNNIIETLGLFSIVNRAFSDLNLFLENLQEEILTNSEKRILLTNMLKGLTQDLEQWINTMFLEQNATDIHYLDASFSDNCLAIETTFSEEEDEGDDNDDDDLEFF